MSEKTHEGIDEMIINSGLKIGYIANEMGLSRQRLYELRLNPKSMGIDQMEKMAEVLDVNFMDIYEISKKIYD